MTEILPTKAQKTRRSFLRITVFLTFLVPMFFAISALGTRFGLWPWEFGLGTLTRNLGIKLILILLLFAVICLGLSFFIKPRKGVWVGMLALVVSVTGLGYGALVMKTATELPFIHDVSTDTQNPPGFTSSILAAPDRQNSLDYIHKTMGKDKVLNSVLQVEGYKDIRTVVRPESPEALFDRALKTARNQGWAVVKSDKTAGIIEATDTSFWFGFKDDISVRIVAGEGGGAVLDIRSVSRVGQSDIGANAKRIRAFTSGL